MSKTKTKSMTVVDVNPRVRMKEVRRMVAAAHKQGNRIDLMGLTGDDIARSQIALQDLLSKEQEKHARARGHIVDQKLFIDNIIEMSNTISNHSLERLLTDQDRMADLATALRKEQELHNLANAAVIKLLDENQRLTSEVEDTMNTLRVALNGSING